MDKGAQENNITPISEKVEEPQAYELNETELIALSGITAQRESLTDYITLKQSKINAQTRQLALVITKRVGLPHDAGSTTHVIDLDSGMFVPRTKPTPDAPPTA